MMLASDLQYSLVTYHETTGDKPMTMKEIDRHIFSNTDGDNLPIEYLNTYSIGRINDINEKPHTQVLKDDRYKRTV